MVVEETSSITNRLNVNNNNKVHPEPNISLIQKWNTRNDYLETEKEKMGANNEEVSDEEDDGNNTDYSDVESSELVLSASESGVLKEVDKVTRFGDVCVNNSSDVHLGNKTYFQGPVTIKQIMYTNPVGFPKELDNNLTAVNGILNPKVLLNGQSSFVNIPDNCIPINGSANGVHNCCGEHFQSYGKEYTASDNISRQNKQNFSTNSPLDSGGISLKTLLARREIFILTTLIAFSIIISILVISTYLILKQPPPTREENTAQTVNFIGISLKTLLARREIFILTTLIAFSIIISILVISTYLILKQPPPTREENTAQTVNFIDSSQPSYIDHLPNSSVSTSKYPLRLILRRDWLAQPPTETLANLKLPIENVVILHSATDYCIDLADCKVKTRDIQSFHVDGRKWSDIAYNFLVGGDGSAYEGRGWFEQGANVLGHNKECYGIAFIGTFSKVLPPERQLEAAKKLIQLGVDRGYIARDYKLRGHRQYSATESPGERLFREIQKWPHYDPTVFY